MFKRLDCPDSYKLTAYLHVYRGLRVQFTKQPSLVKAFVVDWDSNFRLVAGAAVFDNLDGLELGV